MSSSRWNEDVQRALLPIAKNLAENTFGAVALTPAWQIVREGWSRAPQRLIDQPDIFELAHILGVPPYEPVPNFKPVNLPDLSRLYLAVRYLSVHDAWTVQQALDRAFR